MSYYEDLTAYSYSDWPKPMVNVGWLDRAHQFDVAEPDGRLVEALVELATQPTNMMRGYHGCQFCRAEPPVEMASTVDPEQMAYLGSGEIHVAGASGVTYSAPTLIAHYVSAHHYRPPEDFISAAIEAVTARRRFSASDGG
jgi:hypothetical protein